MKLMIDIPYEAYYTFKCDLGKGNLNALAEIVAKGTPYEERPQGEWIIVKDEKWGDNVKCPFCGKELAGTDLNFCCKCGADMRTKGDKE